MKLIETIDKIERMSKILCLVYILVPVMILVGGCAAGRTPNRVELPSDLPQAWTSKVSLAALPITASLLDLVNDITLKQLVIEALQNNSDLSATALRLKAQAHLLYGPRSRLMPKLNTELSADRNNQAINASGQRHTQTRHRMSLAFSWEMDLWGRLADEYNASKQALFSQREDYLLARDALAARVIQTWIDQVAIQRSIAIEVERIEVTKDIESVLMERFKDGIGRLDELSAAKSRTEIAKADLSTLKTDLNRSIRKLEVLLGRYPQGKLLTGKALPEVAALYTEIPAIVLLNRPDIRSAMARVESARNIASATQKARWPSLQLSGQVFRQSARLGKIGSASNYWSILGAVFQPLFEGGRLKHDAIARKIEARAELMALRQVILTAINEVEDVLDLSKALTVQTQAVERALKASEQSSRYFEERYRQGLDSIQNLLLAREQETFVKNRLNELLNSKIRNRINLAMALGVGLDDDMIGPEGEQRK